MLQRAKKLKEVGNGFFSQKDLENAERKYSEAITYLRVCGYSAV